MFFSDSVRNTVARIRIQGLSGCGLKFLAGSGFIEYGAETLAMTLFFIAGLYLFYLNIFFTSTFPFQLGSTFSVANNKLNLKMINFGVFNLSFSAL